MAQLVPLSVSAPGFFGLNKQQSGDVLPTGWATEADNLVIDSVGRLAKRKGSQELSSAGLAGVDIGVTHVYIDTSGAMETIVAQAGKIWRVVEGGAHIDISGTMTLATADNWKFQNFNGKVVGWQDSHPPIMMPTVGGVFADIVAGAGVVPIGNEVLAAWGRLWVLDDDTLYYSDLLLEGNWTGGTAGSTLLTRVWPAGVDTPVALAEFNGHLVIFGKESIIIYSGPEDPASSFSTFAKIEGIAGTGCASRDTVQGIGRDLIWISPDGVRTLGRTIQEKSMPSNDACPQVRDYVVAQAALSTDLIMKSAYSQELGLYVVSFDDQTLAFDIRTTLKDGEYRVTKWPVGWRAYASNREGTFVFTEKDTGHTLKYSGELDNVPSVGTGGDNITINYEGPWNDFSTEAQEIGAFTKYLKSVKLYLFGGIGSTLNFKWAVDYSPTFQAINVNIPTGSGALWGSGVWGTDVWSTGGSFREVRSNVSRSGRVVKFGLTASIGGVPIALNRIDLFAKLGKLAI